MGLHLDWMVKTILCLRQEEVPGRTISLGIKSSGISRQSSMDLRESKTRFVAVLKGDNKNTMNDLVNLSCKYEYDKVHKTSKKQSANTNCMYSMVKRDTKRTKKVKTTK